jgi:hypothetical protein
MYPPINNLEPGITSLITCQCPLPRLLRVPGGVSRSHLELPNTLTRCQSWRTYSPRCTGTNLLDNRSALLVRAQAPALQQGGNPLRPIQREQRSLVREETKALSESRPGSSDGPHGGRILCENERGPRVYSVTKNLSAPTCNATLTLVSC